MIFFMVNRFFSFLILVSAFTWIYIWWNYFYTPEDKPVIHEQTNENIVQKKEIVFTEIEPIEKEVIELTQLEKFKLQRAQDKYYLSGDLKTNFFKILKNEGKLSVYIWNTLGELWKKVGEFGVVGPQLIDIQDIYGTDNELMFIFGNKRYIYYQNENILEELELKFLPIYAKKQADDILLKTKEGIFRYNILTKQLIYEGVFNDFVKVWVNILGIVPGDDHQRKIRFDIEQKTQATSIVLYDRDSKEVKILKTYPEVGQIYTDTQERIYIVVDWEIIEIENI